MRKGQMFNRSIGWIITLISISCMILVIVSMLNLPDTPVGQTQIQSGFVGIDSNDEKLGKLGEMMVEMLPNDLAFTVFVPSERAFEQVLRLRATRNHNFTHKEWDDTYATVSRVLGFSAAPFKIYSDSIPIGKEISFDSISGFTLHISKDLDGVLVVNNIRSKQVDIKKGEMVVHIIDGVIMDAEFELSVRPDDDDDEM